MTLIQLWDRLLQVRSLEFTATSAALAGWNGAGQGSVVVTSADDRTIRFVESGVWRPTGGRDLRFGNVFRWTLCEGEDAIRLEHLRFGEENPVYLFDLVQSEADVWQSAEPHVCREDLYAATMTVRGDRIDLCWSVNGPKKREKIEYTYSCQHHDNP